MYVTVWNLALENVTESPALIDELRREERVERRHLRCPLGRRRLFPGGYLPRRRLSRAGDRERADQHRKHHDFAHGLSSCVEDPYKFRGSMRILGPGS